MRGGRDRLKLVLVLQQAEGAAAEQEHDNHDDRADDRIAPSRGAQTMRRTAAAARPEAVSGRRVRRAPQEVGFMMAKHTRNVKDCPSDIPPW